MRTVAILCAAKKSYYHSMSGVDVYDVTRDARTFPGGMSVVAHPPCRTWSRCMSHFVRLSDDDKKAEQELGVWCCRQVQEFGGIVEQPAYPRLWDAAGLPFPGSAQSQDSFSLHVWQRWWGYPCKKGTWLYFRGIRESDIHIPFCLHPRGGDKKRFERMPGGWGEAKQRSETVPAFAEWLVSLARTANCEIREKSHELPLTFAP